MKTTLKTALRLVIYTSVGIGTLLLLDNNSRFFLTLPVVVILILLAASILGSIRKDALCIAALHYGLVIGYMIFGSIHVNQLDMDRIEILSPLGRVLEDGESIDTIPLQTVIEAEYGSYRGRSEDFYILYKGGHAHIFNRFRKLLSLTRDFSVVERQYFGVPLDFICDNGVMYSLQDFRIVDDDFKPYVRHVTPVDTNL